MWECPRVTTAVHDRCCGCVPMMAVFAVTRRREATQPMPPGGTCTVNPEGTTGGGGWVYDDASLLDLLRVIW